MKKLLTLMLIVFFSACAGNIYAQPVPVEVLSSDFSISGDIAGMDYNTGPFLHYHSSYAESGSVPLANGVGYGSYYNGGSASSEAGFFYVGATAGGGGNGSNWASANADMIFQPLSPMSQLTIYYQGGLAGGATLGGGYSGNIELTDTTDGTQIFNQAVPYSYWNGSNGWYSIGYSFRNNVYELYLSAYASSSYDWQYVNIWTNDLSMVPEPATMFLLGLGLIGVVGVRRKFKK